MVGTIRGVAARRFRWWFPLAVYALTRLVTAVVTCIAQRNQIALPASNGIIRIAFPSGEAPGYGVVMSSWDGQWYQTIATHGYPAQLPLDVMGRVDMSPWAFYPVYPMSVGLAMKLTGLSFYLLAPLFAMLAGAVAMVLLFRLVDDAVGRWEAVVAVVGMCTFVSAPVLQASYTESYSLVALLACLMLLRARRYAWLILPLVVLSLTRNVVLVMAPVILVHLAVRWWNRRTDPFPVRQRWFVAALAAFAGALTGLWPAIAGLGAHDLGAYGQTMAAWNIGAGQIQLGHWEEYVWAAYGGPFGVAAGVLALGAFIWFLLSRRSWHWGPELWAWAGAYPAYQLIATGPHQSRLRYALLGFGFALVLAQILNLRPWRRWRVPLLVAIGVFGIVCGAWWVSSYLVTSHLDGIVNYP